MSRALGRLPLIGLALLSLVVGHHLVFLAAHGAAGYGAAMHAGGHDRYWGPFVAFVAISSLVLAAITLLQFRRLSRLAADVASGRVEALPDGFGDLIRDAASLSVRLALLTVLLFVAQENLEHLSVGAGLPLLGVLGGEHYGSALPLLVAVSSIVALVVALIRWRRVVLARRIAAALARAPRPPVRARRRSLDQAANAGSILGRRLAGRAPPLASAA